MEASATRIKPAPIAAALTMHTGGTKPGATGAEFPQAALRKQVIVRSLRQQQARVGTIRIQSRQPPSVRLRLSCVSGGSDAPAGFGQITVSLLVTPELWEGRQVGEFTPEEHQQLALGLATVPGPNWADIRRLLVPTRSEAELAAYAQTFLPGRAPPPPLVIPPPPPPPHPGFSNYTSGFRTDFRRPGPIGKPLFQPRGKRRKHGEAQGTAAKRLGEQDADCTQQRQR